MILRTPWGHASVRLADTAFGHVAPTLAGHISRLFPGAVLVVACAALATEGSVLIQSILPGDGWSVSPILVVILLGVAIRNTVGVHDRFAPGIRLALQRLLRIGVALLGIRLSLGAVAEVGLESVPIVIGCISAALGVVYLIGPRCGVSERLSALVAAGTSICGASAILAVAPTVRARNAEVSYAVTCIALFGMTATLVYPLLARWVFDGDAHLAGLFLGTSIHDTAQVAGAGLIYSELYGAPEALATATVTKLVRNVFILAVIPLLALWYRSRSVPEEDTSWAWSKAFPYFVIGFLAMAALRTAGDLTGGAGLGLAQWATIIATLMSASKICLLLAMAGVGLSTDLRSMRSLGLAPFLVGLAAAVTVGSVSLLLITVFAA